MHGGECKCRYIGEFCVFLHATSTFTCQQIHNDLFEPTRTRNSLVFSCSPAEALMYRLLQSNLHTLHIMYSWNQITLYEILRYYSNRQKRCCKPETAKFVGSGEHGYWMSPLTQLQKWYPWRNSCMRYVWIITYILCYLCTNI